MVSNELAEALEPIKRLYWILWAALTVPLLLYFVVLQIAMGNEPDPTNAIGPTVRSVLILLVVVLTIGSFFYRRHNRSDAYLATLLGRSDQIKDVEARTRKLIAEAKTDPNISSRLSSLVPFDRRRYCLASDSFLPFVLDLALNESVAVLGFVLALLERNIALYIPFATVALFLNVYIRPDLSNLMERSEQWRAAFAE